MPAIQDLMFWRETPSLENRIDLAGGSRVCKHGLQQRLESRQIIDESEKEGDRDESEIKLFTDWLVSLIRSTHVHRSYISR
jgi:hypothetical protein